MLLKGNGKRNRSGWEESSDANAALDTCDGRKERRIE